MKIGLTYDKREDYNVEKDSEIFADFCSEAEVGYIANAIKECGYEVELIGNMYKLKEQINNGSFDCDLVFIEDEGFASRNREIIVPALLEVNNIPYIGSDAYAMGLSQNKYHTKLVAENLGIKVPKSIYVSYSRYKTSMKDYLEKEMNRLNLEFPLIVKPNSEGYSMGIFKVSNMADMIEKIDFDMENYKQEVLCEAYIFGDEINVPIIGTEKDAYMLGVDICKQEDGSDIDVFTLNQKCFETIIDEAIVYDEATMKTIEDWSLKLHNHFGSYDFSRPDFKITKDKEIYLIEFNPRPGMTQNGPFETCAKAKGKTYTDIIGEIIKSALKRC